jgi:thiol-disulfide isomerase/thioredoxin
MTDRLHRIVSQIKPRHIIILLLVICGALTLYLNGGKESKPTNGQNDVVASKGISNFVRFAAPRPLSDFTFELESGEKAGLEAFRGEVLVVNFWATWCAPCRKEMPQLEALQVHFSDQPVRVIALSLDRGTGDKPRRFLQELGVEQLTFAHDGSYKAGRAVGLIGLPTTLLVDRQGREIGRLAGEADWNSPAAQALVQAAIETQE